MYCFFKGYYYLFCLADLVNNHKSLVLRGLQDIENKLNQAEVKLLTAKNNFEVAKSKAKEIRNQGSILSSQTKKSILLEVEEEIKRLQALSLAFVRLEEDNSVSEMVRLCF